MKVLVVNSMAPFVWGGAEELANHLRENLVAAGHESEILRIPMQWEPAAKLPSQMLLVRALELWNVDRVIALKFPAYLIRHPHKTLWLLHQYRQAYDLLDAGQSNLPPGAAGEEIRQLIHNADIEAFKECRRIYTNSKVTLGRMERYNPGIPGEVLLPPVNDPELFSGATAQGYVFAGGRINAMKRQHLVVEAMASAPSGLKLVVAGPPDTPHDAARLQRLVESRGLGDRVKLDLRFLPRSEIAGYVNNALACAYLPFDEDSLGYVAMEAATAGKPVITSSDSGGLLGLVRDGVTGWVCAPEPAAIAAALAEAGANAGRTRARGEAARSAWQAFGASWPATIERLLQ